MNITIRVYGVFIHNDQVLISEERYKEVDMFKFPGGGMEEGEGLQDALKREVLEEMGLDVEIMDHLYTTDFHTTSTFDTSVQVLSVYFLIDQGSFDVDDIPQWGVESTAQKKERFSWYPIESLSLDQFTFETERKAFSVLLNRLRL